MITKKFRFRHLKSVFLTKSKIIKNESFKIKKNHKKIKKFFLFFFGITKDQI